jgi:hypothetical protein
VRKLVITFLVLLVVLLAADRVAVAVAQSVVAGKMRTAGGLSTTPTVRIRGFPFLTQALAGRYDRIDVKAEDVQRSGVTLGSFDVRVNGAQIPLSDALHGKVTDVPVASLSARTLVTYVELANDSGLLSATVTPKGDLVEVTGRIKVQGITLSGKATSTVRLKGSSLVVQAKSVSILGAHSSLLDRFVVGLLDFDVPISALPYGLRLNGATATPAGVVLTAATGPTVLRPQ